MQTSFAAMAVSPSNSRRQPLSSLGSKAGGAPSLKFCALDVRSRVTNLPIILAQATEADVNRVTAFNVSTGRPKVSWLVPGPEDEVFEFVALQAARAIATGFRENYKIEIDGEQEVVWKTDRQARADGLASEYLFPSNSTA